MAYKKQTWVDGVTPLDAEHLNHMEQGISQLSEEIAAARDYYLLKSPNGTIYKVTVSDTGTLQVVDESGVNLPGLIPGRLLVWNDEFDGDSVDLDKWYFRKFGFDGVYANPNATVHDGTLDLCVKKDAAGNTTGSTIMMTNGRAEFKYGRIEAKMKFNHNFHTAFWCVGQTQTVYNGSLQGKKWCYCGEIDIYEPTESGVYSTLHWGSEDETVHDSKRAGQLDVDYTEWHIYALEWTETSMVFYCDDSVIGTIENLNELGNPDGFKPFNAPHYMILQAKSNANTVEGEYHCYVDWVRYYAPESVSSLIDVQALTLNETEMSLNPNRVKELELTISPDYVTDYTLVWESDNTEVATFAGGNRVTAVGNGTANLTVTAKNGVSANCALTVSDDAYNPVTGITISGADKTNYFTGESIQLSATISPKWATHLDVLWESSNENVATVDNGTVTFLSDGTVDVYAKAADQSGVSASVGFTVKAVITDNIPVENCTVKMTRTGWNSSVDGTTGWVFDIPENKITSAGTYDSGNGYTYLAGSVTSGNNADLGALLTGNYTVSARVRIPAGATIQNEARILEVHDANASANDSNPRVYFGLFNSGNYVLRAYNSGSSSAINQYNKSGGFTPSTTDEQSLNFTFVHGANGSYSLYRNAELIISGTESVAMDANEAVFWMPALLGSNYVSDNDFRFQAFVGYNIAMTAEEVTVLSNALDAMYA